MTQRTLYFTLFLLFVSAQIAFISIAKNVYANPSEGETVKFFGYEAHLVPQEESLSTFFDTQKEKWNEIQEKYHPKLYTPQTTPMNRKNAENWMATCNYLKRADKMETLRGINDFMNKIPGKDDIVLYKQEEYWASPDEFFANWGGDCEDYSFAKYFGLIYLNWSADDLWILLFYHKEHKLFHAALLATVDGKTYVLDNLVTPTHKLIEENEYKKVVVPLSLLSSKGLWVFVEGIQEYQKIELDNKKLEQID